MAQPSSSHRERERERERSSSSRHHRHRTISSTTLLLVLSLVLAVLAVMLSLPSRSGETAAAGAAGDPSAPQGIWGLFTPKRTQALIARESSVAMREAEVARREAELLVGAPGGVLPTQSPVACPICPTILDTPPVQTVIKEVVKETEALTPPGWWDQARIRAEDILDRELKIAEREREISRREEAVNRREHDASRRETWIMEQLVALNNEVEQPIVEEEYIYEPAGSRRKPKALPPPYIFDDAPPIVRVLETKTITHTQHHTVPTQVTVQLPASTRRAASPTPELVSSSSTTHIPRTTAVEIVTEEEVLPDEEDEPTRIPLRSRREPKHWWGGW